MKVTSLKTLDEIFKAICDGHKVFCIDIDYPDAYLANSMKICEISDYLNDSCHLFIALED